MPTANNKVTVHTNVAELTVGKSGDDYSTLTGTKNKLVEVVSLPLRFLASLILVLVRK